MVCVTFLFPLYLQPNRDAVIYLRDQSLIDVADPSEEGEMRQMENGSHMLLKSINDVAASSSLHETNNTLPGTNDLYDVEIASFIDCFPCGLTFQDMGGLKKHLASFHKKTTRRFDLPIREATPPHTLEKHAVMDHDQPQLDEARSQLNGEASSSSQKIVKAQELVPVFNGNGTDRFRTKCTWCDKEFLCEPVDAETMADATGFVCPKCKEKLCGVLERSLSRSNQHILG